MESIPTDENVKTPITITPANYQMRSAQLLVHESLLTLIGRRGEYLASANPNLHLTPLDAFTRVPSFYCRSHMD